MLDTLFKGIFDSDNVAVIGVPQFLLCIGFSLAIGLVMALSYMYRTRYTKSFVITVALLPTVVSIVIMMVNGNIGAGLAVAGTFALVRFRSVPGSAKEITGLFMTVAIGLACGMGYVGCAAIFFVIMAVLVLALGKLRFGETGRAHRQLKITIPENLDYEGLFDDLFEKYTVSHEMTKVRTTNMGTLYELTYDIRLKDVTVSKAFVDEIRCRNGNLNIICGRDADMELM